MRQLASPLAFQRLICFLLPAEKQQRKAALQCMLWAFVWAPLHTLADQAVAAAFASLHGGGCVQLMSECIYTKINHFLMLITFYPFKTPWQIAANPASLKADENFPSQAQGGLQMGGHNIGVRFLGQAGPWTPEYLMHFAN